MSYENMIGQVTCASWLYDLNQQVAMEEVGMQIKDLSKEDRTAIEQVAAMLVESFKAHWPDAWPTMDDALVEVQASFEQGRISRIASNERGIVVGWIGAQHFYSSVWELHPLVVRLDQQGTGIGKALVADLEEQVRRRGAITLMLGTDDDDHMTTLSGVDLYDNTWEHMKSIRNLRRHPYEFYQKLGFQIIGVVPDANGIGKPDILMAKRVG